MIPWWRCGSTCSTTLAKRSRWRAAVRVSTDSDRLLQLALTRLVEIVGEAAGRVPAELQAPCS